MEGNVTMHGAERCVALRCIALRFGVNAALDPRTAYNIESNMSM